jgi:hypothetical protein
MPGAPAGAPAVPARAGAHFYLTQTPPPKPAQCGMQNASPLPFMIAGRRTASRHPLCSFSISSFPSQVTNRSVLVGFPAS